MTKKSERKQYTYLSLFSGCGGFDVGFEKENFKCVGAYDNNPYALHVFSQNLSGPTHLHDLNDLSFLEKITTRPDVVISGSPCQGFSTIGKRDVDDPRNQLLLTGGKVAIALDASVFIGENVLGSLSGEHGIYWDKLKTMLEASGYSTKQIIYNAKDLGLAQLRKRVILYAWKNERLKDFEIDMPRHEAVTLASVFNVPIEPKIDDHNLEYIPIDTDDFIIAQRIGQGQKLSNVRGGNRSIHTWDIPEVFGLISAKEKELLLSIMRLRRQVRRRKNGDADPVDVNILQDTFKWNILSVIDSLLKKGYIFRIGKYVELKNTFNGKFKRLKLNGISPTVDTRFGNYRNYLHPIEHRGLSVREAARIQGFSDDFIFEAPTQKKYEMIGNAVPPPLGEHIAKTIKKKILLHIL